MTIIEKYKGVDIKYNTDNAFLYFEFDGREREVKCLFEAKRIIDEPVWESCDVSGYWIDGTFYDYIGLAKAERKNTKTGRPDWKFKGQYDIEFKSDGLGWRGADQKVYIKCSETDKIYRRWELQREKSLAEQREVKRIIGELDKS